MAGELKVLGPVEAWAGSRRVELGHARQVCVLAALVVDANQVVGADDLMNRAWGQSVPLRGRETLHAYLSRLRRALSRLGEARIVHRSGGWELRIDPEAVDLHRFRRLVARARAASAPSAGLAAVEEALALWRGEPFAGLSTPWLDSVRDALAGQYRAVELEYADLALRVGQHAEVLPDLAVLVDENPLDERLAAHYLLALYRCGRQADALTHYRTMRERLAEELGADPGDPLQRLHRQILTADPALATPSVRSVPEPGVAVVPHQLPAAAAHLVGRDRETAALTALAEGVAGAAVIASVSGTAGIGKTALAVHWAQRVRDRFPDGQLYVNLRGFAPGTEAMDPAEAARGFLAALGIAPQRVPASPEAQIALYRSLLDGKRILVVLDNARDARQARPLLPSSAGAMAVVTSRDRLSGLVALDGAHPISLDLLAEEEAQELLTRRLGPERVAAESRAAQQIIAQCARLPLALAIAATRAAETGFSLATLADELAEVGRLDVLSAGDPASEVRAVFSWSYHALAPEAARLFRLLGLHPGPDFSAAAAASLTGLPLARVRGPLAELTRASLLIEHLPGRYVFHDLLRDYAADLVDSTDPGHEQHAAVQRLLDHYVRSAHTAARLLEPAREPIALPASQPGTSPESPADREQALNWFTAEHAVLLAAVDYASAAGFGAHTWQLAWTLLTFLDRRGQWHDLTAVGRAAVEAADRLADPLGQPVARCVLARACRRHGNLDEARRHLSRALDFFGRAGSVLGQADTCIELARVTARQGPRAIPEILANVRRAAALYQSCGHLLGQAQALTAIGWSHARLGDYEQGLLRCREALPLLEEFDDSEGQAHTWDSLGYAHHHLGSYAQAATCFRRALEQCRVLGDRCLEADVLNRLGDTRQAMRDSDAARDLWQHALGIFVDLEHPGAEQIHAKLAALDAVRPVPEFCAGRLGENRRQRVLGWMR
ncbi:BTAD domain-containing putative transcriptional regulator [Amycolatopsis sp. NPDC054798]